MRRLDSIGIELGKESDIKERCRKIALKNFSLTDGVDAYDKIYKRLLKN
jgi:hypothetical protein